MKKNSNQQSFSVSIRAKRENLHAQIRRKQIQDYFAAKRIEYFQKENKAQKNDRYRILNERIADSRNDQHATQQIQQEILGILKKSPHQNFNFIIVGNFLFQNPLRILQFQQYILNKKNLQANVNECCECYFWCLGIYIKNLCEIISTLTVKKDGLESLQRADEFVSMAVDYMLTNDQLSSSRTLFMQVFLRCIQVFLNIIDQQFFFPINTFRSLIERIDIYYKDLQKENILSQNSRAIKIQISVLMIRIVEIIKKFELYSDLASQYLSYRQRGLQIKGKQIQKLIKCTSTIFIDNIVAASDNRQNCFISIKNLCYMDPIAAGEYFFTKEYLRQMCFLLTQHKMQVGQIILYSFDKVMDFITNKQLSQFLDQNLHLHLLTSFDRGLFDLKDLKPTEKKSSTYLLLTLKVIQKLLNKLQNVDERLFGSVFNLMCHRDFGNLLQAMGPSRFDQQIEEVYSLILDKYFSGDQCQSHSHEYDCENNRNHLIQNIDVNHQSNTYFNGKQNYVQNNQGQHIFQKISQEKKQNRYSNEDILI